MQGSVKPVARWSCPGRTAAICCRRWLTSRCSPRRPGSLLGLHRRTDRSGRSGWRAAGTGNTRSCRHRRGGDSCHSTPRKRVIGIWSPTYPGILFIRTIVLMVRAAMFLSFGRTCLARTFQSAGEGWCVSSFITRNYKSLRIPTLKDETAPTWAFGNFLAGRRSDPEYRLTLVFPALERLTLVQWAAWWDGLPFGTALVWGLTQLQESLLECLQAHKN